MYRLGAVVCALTISAAAAPAAQAGDLAAVLAGLAARTQHYYDRFISIICTETVHQQELKFNLAPLGRPRVTVYELSVSRDPRGSRESEFRVERTLQTVNGRPSRRNQTPECTDPKTGSPEPMAFLLASNQPKYRFTLTGSSQRAAAGPAVPGATAIDFVEAPPDRVHVKWEGHCFEAEGGGHHGRVWFDPGTYDILQVEVRLAKPFLVPLPSGSFGVRPAIRVERSETTMRFAPVDFQEPAETVLLPQSIETLHVIRGIPSLRIKQTLGGFRRFLTKSEIRTTAF